MIARLREDLKTVFEKDPAARNWWEVVTCYPGLHAIWMHRIAHGLWRRGLYWPARFLSHLNRFLTGIEIHPGATIGRRFFIDHGMGIVIGETAEVGDDVLMYKGAVLGGTSLNKGKRHPTVGDGVVIGSNAIILGPITIGANARIGSGAVVVRPVPADSTAVGVPARVVRGPHIEPKPSIILQHGQLPDPIAEALRAMEERVREMESELAELRRALREAAAAPAGQLAATPAVAEAEG
ncbi:MAG TPA: serine O-acetyltransferase [Chloroflexi bacterium]|jgi:serine O-acetyltransferase|nr:serine O-acetyltransferase [Chloroflexota bacterium]